MSRYNRSRLVRDRNDVVHQGSLGYPEIPITSEDMWVQAGVYDRLDNLAQRFYKDPSLWWIIARANNIGKGSMYITEGKTIRIPANPGSIQDTLGG